MKRKERTYELTNWCPHDCPFCSSDATKDHNKATWLLLIDFLNDLERVTEGGTKPLERINLSGGEPMAHPDFYKMLIMARKYAKDVVVYTNALTHIRFNAHVIDHVRVEANLTVAPGVDRVRILKRVEQGREATRPEVKLSRNWTEDCTCDHRVIRPNGQEVRSPCDKWSKT